MSTCACNAKACIWQAYPIVALPDIRSLRDCDRKVYLAEEDSIVHAHSDVLLSNKLWDVRLLQQPHDLARGVADHRLHALILVLLDPVLQSSAHCVSSRSPGEFGDARANDFLCAPCVNYYACWRAQHMSCLSTVSDL